MTTKMTTATAATTADHGTMAGVTAPKRNEGVLNVTMTGRDNLQYTQQFPGRGIMHPSNIHHGMEPNGTSASSNFNRQLKSCLRSGKYVREVPAAATDRDNPYFLQSNVSCSFPMNNAIGNGNLHHNQPPSQFRAQHMNFNQPTTGNSQHNVNWARGNLEREYLRPQQQQHFQSQEFGTTTRSIGSSSTAPQHNTPQHTSNIDSNPSINSADDNERSFMKISNALVTQHMTGKFSTSVSEHRLLHQYLPLAIDRKNYWKSLQRNLSYLPMFPEPGEHPSFAMTRYVERVFGPHLNRELDDDYSMAAPHMGQSSSLHSRSGDPNAGPMFPPPTPTKELPRQQNFESRPHYQPRESSNHWIPPPVSMQSDEYNLRNNREQQPTFPSSSSNTFSSRGLSIQLPPSTPNNNPSISNPVTFTSSLKSPLQTPTTAAASTLAETNLQSPEAPFLSPTALPSAIKSRHGTSLPTPLHSNRGNLHDRVNNGSSNFNMNSPYANLSSTNMIDVDVHSSKHTMYALHDKHNSSNGNGDSSDGRENGNGPSIHTQYTSQHSTTKLATHEPLHNNISLSSNQPPPQPLPLVPPAKYLYNQEPANQTTHNGRSQQSTNTLPGNSLLRDSLEYSAEDNDSTRGSVGSQSARLKEDDRGSKRTSGRGNPESQGINKSHNGRDRGTNSSNAKGNNHMAPFYSDLSTGGEDHSFCELRENESAGIDSNPESFESGEDKRDRGRRHVEEKEQDPSPTPSQYQLITNKDMLPPLIPRERILYEFPNSSLADRNRSNCFNYHERNEVKKRDPTYLQLYIKCERSEPLVQPSPDTDIVTWYQNGDNAVTADRTLVVRGTTSLFDLIRGIIHVFGLSSSNSISGKESGSVQLGHGSDESQALLECHNGICFVSDIKATTCAETSETQLTPLPIPGFYYKYVDRITHFKSKSLKDHEKGGSSVLSNDPAGLQRTLIAQLLDRPIYPTPDQLVGAPNLINLIKKGNRTRLALVYCTPKREAYKSSRTQRGTLSETIYHFQILLEGIVDENELPSSFQSQAAIRCVGATGGVHGGNIVDTQEEVDFLNRQLWGDQQVIGLISPTGDQERDLDQIIDLLRVPLFDDAGNQTHKEFVVDKCFYHIYSGKLSMEVAKKTQHTVEAIQGTTEWLATQVEYWTKSLTQSANTCMDDDLLFAGDEFDNAVSRVVYGGNESRWFSFGN